MKQVFIAYFLLLLSFWAPITVAETVYKGTDAEGNTVFSDVPIPDAEKIDIQPAQTYTPPAKTTRLANEPTAEAAVTSYTVKILSPQDQETFTTDINSLSVVLSVEPALTGDDKIQIFVNGSPYGSLYNTTNITITFPDRLPRNTYSIQARVVSEADPSKVKGESNTVTVFQKRHTILLPH